MSYNILNKNVNFQGATQGSIEDIVDTHSTQSVGGPKTFTGHLTASGGLTVIGIMSASSVISASAFYGPSGEIGGSGVVTALNNQAENRLVSIGATTTQLDGEANLTFDGTTLTLDGTLSGSGNISGSQFYGEWAGGTIDGSKVQLASNGGITNLSGLKLDAGVAAVSSLGGSDIVLIPNADTGTDVKRTTVQTIANFAPVDSYGTQGADKVLLGAGGKSISGASNLNFFGGSTLAITGSMSASAAVLVGGSIKAQHLPIEAPTIAQDHILFIDNDDNLVTKCTFSNLAAVLSGDGLIQSSNMINVQTSGAIHITSDKVSLTGSFAGNGLSYDGGVDSISKVSVELQSNSGLTVDATGLKLNMNGLASATPAPASDSLSFIDSDGDKKCSFDTFLAAIAGANLGVSGSQLTASAGGGGAVSSVANGADNRIATFSSANALNGEGNLTFDGSKLLLTGSLEMSGSGITVRGAEAGTAALTLMADQGDDPADITAFSVADGGNLTIDVGGSTTLLTGSSGLEIVTSATANSGSGWDGTVSGGVVESYVSKVNGEIVTTLLINISGAVSTSGASPRVIGDAGGAGNAYLTKLDSNINGYVYKVSMACVEQPAGGEPDLDLYLHSSAQAEGANVSSGGTQLINRNGDWVVGDFQERISVTSGGHNMYVHLATGDSGGGTAGSYTSGKYVIKFLVRASDSSHFSFSLY